MAGNRIVNNAKWIILCRIVQSIMQLIVGMLSARYLGPSNYGIINYAASVVAFVIPIMQLGLQATLVQEFVEKPENEGKILGTSLILELISGFLCFISVICFVLIVNRSQTVTVLVCVLYSICIFFRALELFQCWFQYRLKSKYPSIVMLVSYTIVSIYRIYLLITGKSVYWFAIVNSLDYGIIGISLFVIYKKKSSHKLSFSFNLAKSLLKRSRYYIVASMMVTVFQNTDHIMLKMISGDAQNGYYTAAITSAGVCLFVYTAIVDSMRPVILSYKKDGNLAQYKKNISMLYSIIIYLTLLQGLGFTIFAKLIIWILFGVEYMDSVSVLQILVWYVTFNYIGSIRNIWLLAEGKQSILWKINFAGAILNIILNSVLIPFFGANGAAFASLVTQIFTNFIFGFIYKPIRENNILLLKGLNPKFLFSMINKYIPSKNLK